MSADWVLGFMSGTSLDGVDAALLKTDGERIEAFGPSDYRPYAPAERARLRAALERAAGLSTAELRAAPDRFDEEARLVADAHGELAEKLLGESGAERPVLLGFHGQTLLHRPDEGYTLQIGDAARLAQRLGVAVVHDFRAADVASGGQGAPFAPFYHFALAKSLETSGPVAMLNLGGVGNVTWIDAAAADPAAPGALLAFDTGPANALIDDWMTRETGAARDENGAAAASGVVDEVRVARWLAASAYLGKRPPKSLDRQDFAYALKDMDGLSTEDGAATLTAFTAATVAAARDWLPEPPTLWLASGGGRLNPTLLRMLAERVGAPVARVEDHGFDGDMIEAQAFAHLAARSRAGLPLSAPGTTGAPTPILGGRLAAA